MSARPSEQYVLRLLDETREEIVRADTKANVLLAAASITIAVLLTSLMNGDLRLAQLPNSIEWLGWAGIACIVAGMVFLARAVLPTRNSGQDSPADYFRDFAVVETPQVLADALPATRQGEHERHIRQLHVISRIVERKYRRIRSGGIALAFGAATLTLTALIDNFR